MFDLAVEAITSAGFEPGREIALAVDVAASHFYRDGNYELSGRSITGKEMVKQLIAWSERYPIVSIEDGLAEEDWDHWAMLYQELGAKCLVLGDDLLCTNSGRINKATQIGAANAILLKDNQI